MFDHEVADALGDNVVLAHLNHPLVQRCLRLLRQTIWGGQHDIALHRVTARVVADRDLEHPTIIAWGRLVITGGDGERLHEQLITAGGTVQGGRFVRMERVGDVQAVLDVTPLPDLVPDAILQQFQDLWPDLQPRVDAALRARERQRADALERVVKQREQEEIDAITAVLTELRQTIERELTQPEILQMALFTDPDDRDQAQADRNALEHRLERIPEELEREIEAIRRRYARTEPRLFPVAVTLFIPRSIALNARG